MTSTSSDAGFEVVVFAGPSDVGGFLELCVDSVMLHVEGAQRFTIVTPDAERQRCERLIERVEGSGWTVVADEALAPEADDLPGWFRQQQLKLHLDRLVGSTEVVCIGADTVVLEPVVREDLFRPGEAVCHHFPLPDTSPNLWFELARLAHLSVRLGIIPRRTIELGSLICDVFPMITYRLPQVRAEVAARVEGGLGAWLRGLGRRSGFDLRFGEWTLYWLILLDVYDLATPIVDGVETR